MHQSVATINSPEFLNLQPLDINPLMSKCDIKVFYLGANRNHSFISKQVAIEIGKNLRGAPIVGYYRDSKEDFTDHGEKVIIDDEGVKFECQTVPYGFVSPDAKVWFQDFQDSDGMGNTVIRKYLMTTGYLWTDQFPESSLPVNEGRPQSMEFKPETLKGNWQKNYENGLDFFIINDAIIQKICILGDDVEPCFEGASVTAPDVSLKFTLDDNFKHTYFSMMQDLKNALSGGGQQMDNLEKTAVVENENSDSVVTEFTQTEEKTETTSVVDQSEGTSVPADYVKKDEEKEKKEEEEKTEDSGDSSEDSSDGEDKDDEDDDKDKKNAKKYELIENQLEALKTSYQTLQNQYQELVEFKREIDNQKKDALIAEFYMLSDADKADVISNKEKYTLEEIKTKLSIICFDKKVSFSLDKEKESNEEETIVTYTLNNDKNDSLPEWVKAVKEQEQH